MKIVGSEKNSVIEWPGKLSYVIFLEGCNLKCPFVTSSVVEIDGGRAIYFQARSSLFL